MNAVVGVLLLAASAVFLSWGFNQLRRPNPSAWARIDLSAQLIVFVWIALMAAGTGFLANAAYEYGDQPPTAEDYWWIAAILAAATALLFLLRRQWRSLNSRTGPISIDIGPVTSPAASQAATAGPRPAQDDRPPSHTPRAA